MSDEDLRWVIPSLDIAILTCGKSNSKNIRCIVDLLGENLQSIDTISEFMGSYERTMHVIKSESLNAAMAIKVSGLGALNNPASCKDNLEQLFKSASKYESRIEIDMEGTPLVGYTIDTAAELSKSGFPVTMALQAYLNRSSTDLTRATEAGITVRIVKGAYIGDTSDFVEIQDRFKALVKSAISSKKPFSVGTHDPQLIKWIKQTAKDKKDQIEFCFLRGLGQETSLQLAEAGWRVAEYMPFGAEKVGKGYVIRRLRYLKDLEGLGRQPVP
jgi:proline dehydrogenase